MKKKKILIVGGSGYIGTVMSKKFLNEGQEVVNLDNHLFNNEFSIKEIKKNKKYTLIHGNLLNEEDLIKSSSGVTDVVILAGIVGDPLSKKYPEVTQEINETGIKKSIEFFNNQKINKIIFASTCSNYGLIKDNELADENFILNPLSIYAKTKVNIEKYLLNRNNQFSFSPVILRFATAFGLSERMRFDLTVNQFTHELLLGNELIVYDPDTWRPYFHTEDFAKVVFKILDLENDEIDKKVFNVGSNENNYTKRNLVDLIKQYIPKAKIKIEKDGFDKRNYKVDFNKINSLINFKAKSVSSGIEEIINEFNNNKFKDYKNNFEKYGNYKIIYER